MAQIIITKAQLLEKRACKAYERSPEWVPDYGYGDGEGALVYSDWETTRARLLSTMEGTAFLSYLVAAEFVPMTREEFRAVRAEQKKSAYDQIGRKDV